MIFIDTNVFLNYLYETHLSDKAEKIFGMRELCISGIVINETLFVIARTKAFNKLNIKNKLDKEDFVLLMKKYKLLPNDAIIAATCKHRGINKIATFDSDFERVDFLEII